jgi:hypothetical protein
MEDANVKTNPSVVNRVHDSLHFTAEPCIKFTADQATVKMEY